MTRFTPPALAALLAAFLGGPALATPESEAAFARLDTDRSGTISRAEFRVLRERLFAQIDSDGSGTLSPAEVDAAQSKASQQAGLPRSNRIWAQDANGDGKLSLAEYTSELRGFDFADRNHDGALSRAEFDRIARYVATARN